MNKMEERYQKEYGYSKGTTSSITIQVNSKKIHEKIAKLRNEERLNLSIGDLIIHAIGCSLKEFSQFNSFFSNDGMKKLPDINIGYSINLGKGPRIVVIRNVDQKSLIEVASEIKKLAVRYMRDELSDLDTQGGTFSVSNLSSFNVYTATTPVFENQSSLISIASEYDSLEVVEDRIIPIKKFNISLSFDFRVADCQQALQFLNKIKSFLENDLVV